MKAITKYKGAIKLSAIGDALGWVTEFESSERNLIKKFGTSKIDTFFNWEKKVGGRFNGYIDRIEAGSYSDDTQLLLSVARSIKSDGRFDREYFSKNELPSWLLYSRGAGRTVKNAAKKIQRKSASWNNNFYTFKAGKKTIDYRESGANGAAMRILPIVLANLKDTEKIKEEVFANSIITHGHSRAILGALVYAYAIDTILTFDPNSFDPANFIILIGKDFQQKFDIPFINNPEYAEWVYRWNQQSFSFIDQYRTTLDETQEQLRSVYKGLSQKQLPKEILERLGCLNNETKSSGIATVLAGIYLATKYHDSPIEAIKYAVNYFGSDTDSIAAFTGGLIGSLHGSTIIPQKWDIVQDSKYLNKVAEDLLSISEETYIPPESTVYHDVRYFTFDKDNYFLDELIFYNPLGLGRIVKIDRQIPITKGKYNLIIDVDFEIGQTCRFSKLFSGYPSETLIK